MKNHPPINKSLRHNERFAGLKRFILGDDVFISYARSDSADYALSLATELTKKGLSCYLDQWGTQPGQSLPYALVKSLNRSTIMVMLGSKAAVQSASVLQEVNLFLKTGRSIIPVSFDKALETSDLYERIAGIAVFKESSTALITPIISEALVDRIINAEGFVSKSKRLRQSLWMTIFLIGAIIIAGVVTASYFSGVALDQRLAATVSEFTSESVVALKQEQNPSKARDLALEALSIDSTSVPAWGALMDARYSQVFSWYDQKFTVPNSESFHLSGILGSADLSADKKDLVVGSWDPYIANLWHIDTGQLTSLAGYSGLVKKVQFAPNDSTFFVAPVEGPVRIYDRSGVIISRLDIGDHLLTFATYSNSGEDIVTTFLDGTATIWNAGKGERVVRLEAGVRSPASFASFSSDDRRILTAHDDGSVIMWNQNGEVDTRLNTGSGRVNTALFSPDGCQVITASQEGQVALWSSTGERFAQITHRSALIPDNPDPVVGATWAPNGERFLSFTEAGNLHLINSKGAVIRTINAHNERIRGAEFTKDGQYFLTFAGDNTMKLWTEEGHPLLTLGEFTGPVLSAGISHDNSIVFGSSWDGSAKLFRLTNKRITSYSGQTGIPRVAITAKERNVISVATTGRAYLWKLDGTLISVIEPRVGWLHDVIPSYQGDRALIAADSGGLLWNLHTLQWKRLDLKERFGGARFFSNGGRIIVGTQEGQLQILDKEGNLIRKLGTTSASINDLDLSRDEKRVAVALDSGRVEIWSSNDAERLWVSSNHNQYPVNSVRFSKKGDRILSAGTGDYRAILSDLKGNPLQFFNHADEVLSAVFSEDDQLILTNSADGTAKLWSLEGELMATLPTPSTLNEALFSKTLPYIITASNDGNVRLWDYEGRLLVTLPAGSRSIYSIDLTSDGEWLVTASSSGEIYGWNLEIY